MAIRNNNNVGLTQGMAQQVFLWVSCTKSEFNKGFLSREVDSTWMAFGGNARDLGSFGEETNKITTLHQSQRRKGHTDPGNGVTIPCNSNANPFVPVPPNELHARITQELNELRSISAMINSHLKNIDHTQITVPPNEIDMDNLESIDELIDTPLFSPFLDSDDESEDGEVLNELDEKFVTYFNPLLPMNIITRKAYKTIMAEGVESTGMNLVAIVKDVYVFVGSFTYVTDFVVLEDIGEFIVSDMTDVVMGRPFRAVTQLDTIVLRV
ncbi:hypothetical protein Tco_0355279 [Tanacetum coccineum]